jgi:hypothetical protein
MPPSPQWYAGREAIASFALAWTTCGGLHLVPTAANGQPAFAVYKRGADTRWAAHSIHVLTLEHGIISTLTLFVPPTGPRLFDALWTSAHSARSDWVSARSDVLVVLWLTCNAVACPTLLLSMSRTLAS